MTAVNLNVGHIWREWFQLWIQLEFQILNYHPRGIEMRENPINDSWTNSIETETDY